MTHIHDADLESVNEEVFRHLFWRGIARLQAWQKARRDQALLRALSPEQIRDMGITLPEPDIPVFEIPLELKSRLMRPH